jgi:hypothetical protein
MAETMENEGATAGDAGDSTRKPGEDVAAEFSALGKNLMTLLQSAWESEERRKLQGEIEAGLTELGNTLNQAVTDFRESPTGQRLKEEAEGLRTRVRSGEVETEIREELLVVLRRINLELEKATTPRKQGETPPKSEE